MDRIAWAQHSAEQRPLHPAVHVMANATLDLRHDLYAAAEGQCSDPLAVYPALREIRRPD
jgi:hypothetical protein